MRNPRYVNAHAKAIRERYAADVKKKKQAAATKRPRKAVAKRANAGAVYVIRDEDKRLIDRAATMPQARRVAVRAAKEYRKIMRVYNDRGELRAAFGSDGKPRKVSRPYKATRKNAGARSIRKTKKLQKAKGRYTKAGLAARGRLHDVAKPRRVKRRVRHNGAESAAAAAFEGFHGRPATKRIELNERVKEHLHLADVGELVALEVLTSKRGVVIDLTDFLGARLCMNPKRTQLYVEGGDQKIDLGLFGLAEPHKDLEVLGPVRSVKYFTTKDHLGRQGGTADYHHRFGERGGKLPFALYDTRNKKLVFAGGDYTLPDEGIDD